MSSHTSSAIVVLITSSILQKPLICLCQMLTYPSTVNKDYLLLWCCERAFAGGYQSVFQSRSSARFKPQIKHIFTNCLIFGVDTISYFMFATDVIFWLQALNPEDSPSCTHLIHFLILAMPV